MDATTAPTSIEQIAQRAGIDIDPQLVEAGTLVVKEGKCSTSYIQRRFGIGFNAAARIIEKLEALGIVSAPNVVGKREVLISGQIADAPSAPEADAQDKPRMKETAADREVSDKVFRVAADQIRGFVEQFERLDAEKKDIADQQRQVMAAAKGAGYDTKVLRRIIALRKRDTADIAEEEAILDMYKDALGM